MKTQLLIYGVLSLLLFSCMPSEGAYEPVSKVIPVSADLSLVPYPKLSDYHFFVGDIKNQTPSPRVLPYEPASSLFTDYAKKKRFVWMPNGTQALYNSSDSVLLLPIGGVLIKTFYYDDVYPKGVGTKIIETRLMIRKNNGWTFANYKWNDSQTDAFLILNDNDIEVPITWIENGMSSMTTNYKIPATSSCIQCHSLNNNILPIGIKPQNLHNDYNYSGVYQNQLSKWVQHGFLQGNFPGKIIPTVNYKDVTKSLNL